MVALLFATPLAESLTKGKHQLLLVSLNILTNDRFASNAFASTNCIIITLAISYLCQNLNRIQLDEIAFIIQQGFQFIRLSALEKT